MAIQRLYEVARVIGSVVALGAVAGALLIVLLPLPTEQFLGLTVASCGPNLDSDSSLQVLFDPSVVNQGEPQLSPDASASEVASRQWDDTDLINLCAGKAESRAQTAALLAVLGLVVGIGVPWVIKGALISHR